jgi:hypothetical protein
MGSIDGHRQNSTLPGIALAEDGGKVRLGRGIYGLSAPVHLANHVWLRGAGRGTKLRVSADNADGLGLMCQSLKGVVISDLALSAGENGSAQVGIVVDDCDDCQVRDVFAVGFEGRCALPGQGIGGARQRRPQEQTLPVGRVGRDGGAEL